MPHQCTTCGRTFADGSKEMLSGCPDCGGNKFQFKPASAASASTADESPGTRSDSDSPGSASSRSDPPAADAGDGSSGTAPDSAPSDSAPSDPTSTRADSSAPSSAAAQPSSTPSGDAADTDEEDAEVERGTDEDEPHPPAEDHAQASARTDMVSADELADAASASKSRPTPEEVDGRVIEPQTEDRPGLEELREELNSQFESIKIVSPGQYELNLMELYDRQEYIISLQEDGRYVIEVPGSWDDPDD